MGCRRGTAAVHNLILQSNPALVGVNQARAAIEKEAQSVLGARAQFPGSTLYNPLTMPPALPSSTGCWSYASAGKPPTPPPVASGHGPRRGRASLTRSTHRPGPRRAFSMRRG
ncbi:type IIL restriction-modification enzyme MmeI [Melaminivora suipulveris]|uniref:type IIL restriction-modification enzyme MmeI n=1 Tax=Melaminivora suipulveris TaxID=2109913 RepID=UPI003AACCC38